MSQPFLSYQPQQFFIPNSDSPTVPITPITQGGLGQWLDAHSQHARNWVTSCGFQGKSGQVCLLPGPDHSIERVLFGLGDKWDFWSFGALPTKLPKGVYHLETQNVAADPLFQACLAWTLGAYQFGRYKKHEGIETQLVCPDAVQYDSCIAQAEAVYFARDLINTPAEDMGPAELSYAAQHLSMHHGAAMDVIVGEELLDQNFPAIHLIGRASTRHPRLIDIQWRPKGGSPKAKKVTLIGKGITFDSGGLDIKPSSGMLNMKKDMGGAANVLGLAHMIMRANLDLNLRILIPAADNMISGNAVKPMDIVKTRSGLTVEIGNTDAEGRVVLCDAISYALEDRPDIMIDCATLTGAARIAMGLEVPALFCNNEDVSQRLLDCSKKTHDPLWPLPLWDGYRSQMKTNIADLSSTGTSAYGGAITAALYLEEFIRVSDAPETPWAHIDMMAWNPSTKSGRPEGGEAMAIRALNQFLKDMT